MTMNRMSFKVSGIIKSFHRVKGLPLGADAHDFAIGKVNVGHQGLPFRRSQQETALISKAKIVS